MDSNKNSPDLDFGLLNELRDIMGPDFATLVTSWRRDAGTRIAAMIDTIERCDAAGLRQLAHSLKGSSANLGARNVADMCQELEILAGEEKLAGARQRLEVLQGQVEKTAGVLEKLAAG